MLPAKTTQPVGAAFLLAGNKLAPPSVVSAKQAPAGAAGGVVLAVDGSKRAMAALAGRGAFSDSDNDPKEFPDDLTKKVAEEMSSLLRILRSPKDIPFPHQSAFSKEVDALQKICDSIVEGSPGFNEDGAITILIGVQARIKLLLNTENKEGTQDLLLSVMAQIKASVDEYISAQYASTMAKYDVHRKTIYGIAEMSGVEPTPTVCTEEEVKTVLEKTFELLQSEPVNSTRGMAGLYYKARSNCRTLLEDVEKNGVKEKTGLEIFFIHAMAICVLGQHKKFFNYDDRMDPDRLWMYEGWTCHGVFTDEWKEKTEQFVDNVFADAIKPAVDPKTVRSMREIRRDNSISSSSIQSRPTASSRAIDKIREDLENERRQREQAQAIIAQQSQTMAWFAQKMTACESQIATLLPSGATLPTADPPPFDINTWLHASGGSNNMDFGRQPSQEETMQTSPTGGQRPNNPLHRSLF